jgi:hypothetical protein
LLLLSATRGLCALALLLASTCLRSCDRARLLRALLGWP